MDCTICGKPMRRTYIVLTLAAECRRIPSGWACTEECEEERTRQRRIGQAERDEAAIQEAIERGVIDP